MPPTLEKQSFKDLCYCFLGFRKLVKVKGWSMFPQLSEGDTVLVNPYAYKHKCPQAGDLILIKHPYISGVTMIKRVERVESRGRLYVRGDNPKESTDSRAFGLILPDAVLGQITKRME